MLADYCIGKHLLEGIQSPQIRPHLVSVLLKQREVRRAKKRISAIQDKIVNLTVDIWDSEELEIKLGEL